ncbi:hypothetical protein [Streptomyces sp. NPDC017941]|uniref:hypothetical protein n=1 Tax=Streptomyces sp. NPDC017941 TaxID=3365018 RepID=UPI0037978C7F
MTAIKQINVLLQTADIEGAGTDELIYLGIAGREFLLNLPKDETDTDRNKSTRYVLGEKANVARPEDNDPRMPQLDTDDLDRFPVYVRLSPLPPRGNQPQQETDWVAERVTVTVNPGTNAPHYFDQPHLINDAADRRIKLGERSGTILHLKRNDDSPLLP